VVGITTGFGHGAEEDQGVVEMTDSTESQVPWILWPFYAVWKLLTFILNVTGRILCVLLGMILMAAGVGLSLSIVGAIIGIPLVSFGFLLVVRALF